MMKAHRKRSFSRRAGKNDKFNFGKYECLLALTVFTLLVVVGTTFHIVTKCELNDHEAMPNVIQTSVKNTPAWETLSHYSLTLVENKPGIVGCSEGFIPLKSAEECRIASFHLQREFISSSGRGPCVLRPYANPPSISYESKNDKRDKHICKKILQRSENLDYIPLAGDCPGDDITQMDGVSEEDCQMKCNQDAECAGFTFMKMRCWLKSGRCDIEPGKCDPYSEFCFFVKPRDTMHDPMNLLETDVLARKLEMLKDKAEKRRRKLEEKLKEEQQQGEKDIEQQQQREKEMAQPAEEKAHVKPGAPGQSSDAYEYIGNGWCTNKDKKRIKLLNMHWHSKPAREDISMEFCEKLCDEEPTCGGYVSSVMEDGKEHQCDILTALDNKYDDGIVGIFCVKCFDINAGPDHRHCFKRKNEPKLPAQPLVRPKPNAGAWGVRLAARFNHKCRDMWPVKHWTDAVGTTARGIVFVENVKAGSSSIRRKLGMLSAGVYTEEIPVKNKDARYQCDRMSTGVWDAQDIYDLGLSVFSWVRDPVEKFESGVRQAWYHDPDNMLKYSADDMLDLILNAPLEKTNTPPEKHCGEPFNQEYGWLNEHLQPSSWRLTGETNDRQHLNFDFIGKLETFDRDWNEMLKRINLEPSENYMVPILTDMWTKNKKEPVDRSRLSPDSIRKMCNSQRYGREWDCFDYDLPKVCQEV